MVKQLIFLIFLLFSFFSFCMEVDILVPYFPRDIVTTISTDLTFSDVSAFLRTCTTYYNMHAKGLASYINTDDITEETLHTIQFGLNRYIQGFPEKCSRLSVQQYTQGLIYYAKKDNVTMFSLLIHHENPDQQKKRYNVLKAFKYQESSQTKITHNLRAYTGIANIQNSDGYLLQSLRDNNTTAIDILLQNDINVNYQCPTNGATALYTAVEKKKIDIVKRLLALKADPNIKSFQPAAPLCAAIAAKETDIVLLLLQNHADINARQTEDGNPCLHYACYFGLTNMVKLLLAHNANPYLKNRHGVSAIQCATLKKNYCHIVDILSLWQKDHPPAYYQPKNKNKKTN